MKLLVKNTVLSSIFLVSFQYVFFVCKLTYILPTEASSSSRTIRVQVAISEVTLLVEPQTTLVIIHYLLPVGTFHLSLKDIQV